MEVDLHQAAVHLRVATAEASTAKKWTDRHFRRLLILAPFPFHPPLQPPHHPIADGVGDTLAHRRLGMDYRIDSAFARFTL